MAAKYYKRVEKVLIEVEETLNTGSGMHEAVSEVISDRKFDLWEDEDGDNATPLERLDETIADVESLIGVLRDALIILNNARQGMKVKE